MFASCPDVSQGHDQPQRQFPLHFHVPLLRQRIVQVAGHAIVEERGIGAFTWHREVVDAFCVPRPDWAEMKPPNVLGCDSAELSTILEKSPS